MRCIDWKHREQTDEASDEQQIMKSLWATESGVGHCDSPTSHRNRGRLPESCVGESRNGGSIIFSFSLD